MATHARQAQPKDGAARRIGPVHDLPLERQRPDNARQLELDLRPAEQPEKPRYTTTASAATLGPRLALSPDEASALLESAPEDDEPTSAGEDASAREAWAEYRRGESTALEQLRREAS